MAGGCIAAPGAKDKKTGPKSSEAGRRIAGPFEAARAGGELGFRRFGLSLASRAAMRAFSASFSSRASRAISLTASNSSRRTTSRSLEDPLGLGPEQGVELAPHALGDAGRVVHQPCHLVEKPVVGLGHRRLRDS